MKSNGQIGYEAFCESIRWLRPRMTVWLKLNTSEKDAWEAAGDAVAAKVKDELEKEE